MRSRVFLAACTLAVAGTAMAQEVPVVQTVEQRTIDVHGNPITVNPYTSRVIGPVFDNGFSTAAGALINGVGIGSTHVLEDFDFTGGPFETAAVRRVTGYGFTTQTPSTAPVCPSAYQALIEIFEGPSCNYELAQMLSDGAVDAVPIHTARLSLTQTCGVQTLWTVNLAPNGVGGAGDVSFVMTDIRGFIRLRLVETGTETLRPYAGTGGTLINSPVFGTGTGINAVGTITPSYGRDLNASGNNLAFPYAGGPSGLEGGTPVIVGAGAGAHEHRRTSATLTTAWRMKIDGDVTCIAPGFTTNLGILPNGVTTVNTNISAGQTRWYSFEVGAINDLSETFLDIDAEGSAVSDLTFALYNSLGQLISGDTEDGSGLLPQLTYGICRRLPVGDGRDYDGRDGQLAAGTYYLAVGGSLARFGFCFNNSDTSTQTGDIRININTNGSANGSVPPGDSVPPTPVANAGKLIFPGFQSSEVAAGPLNVNWYQFNLSRSTDAAVYVDIDTSGTANANTDTEIAVYDSAGNLVASDDDSGTNFHSSLSFGGTTNPRPPLGSGASAGLPFDGRNGNLACGETYYVAVSLFNTVHGVNRWCARSTSGSNLTVLTSILTNTTTPCHGCCVADFDDGSGTGTPDGGVTIEDLLHYLALFDGGFVCADVDDGSATGTPDGGVTIEDLLYYLARFDAGC